MQIETARKLVANGDAPADVAARTKRGRKNADPKLARQDRDDAARDPTLRGHAYFVNPFAGEIVHPARTHHTKNVLDVLTADGPFARHRINASVGQRCR